MIMPVKDKDGQISPDKVLIDIDHFNDKPERHDNNNNCSKKKNKNIGLGKLLILGKNIYDFMDKTNEVRS